MFSFFSGKGGVGKTTLTILLASYVAYYLNRRVLVIDAERPDGRIIPFRTLDEDLLGQPGTPLYNYACCHAMPSAEQYFDIREYGLAVGEYTSSNVCKYVKDISYIKQRGAYDLMLVDFPARYDDNMPIHALALEGLLDGVYIPTRLEQQERRSACIAAMGLASCGLKPYILWNDIDSDIVKRGYPLDRAEEDSNFLSQYGVIYSPYRIKHFRKASQSSEDQCFVRSTVCWPEKYVRRWCPELISLFEEICRTLGL